jgi:hypothetical protein
MTVRCWRRSWPTRACPRRYAASAVSTWRRSSWRSLDAPRQRPPRRATARYSNSFNWLDEEGEIDVSPMIKMRPPKIPETPVPVLSDDHVRRPIRRYGSARRAD